MDSPPQLPEPDILLEQGAVIVLNKPGGLLTQAPPGIDSLEFRTKQFLKRRDEKPGKVYLGVPHRLDRPVSGVMVVVKNVRAAKRISDQIQERTVVKKILGGGRRLRERKIRNLDGSHAQNAR